MRGALALALVRTSQPYVEVTHVHMARRAPGRVGAWHVSSACTVHVHANRIRCRCGAGDREALLSASMICAEIEKIFKIITTAS